MKKEEKFLHKLESLDPNRERPTPKEVIEFIDNAYPDLKGLCYYDKEEKALKSKDRKRAVFIFNGMWGVLEVYLNPDL
jgi:hypothetical protein